ncbi:MAG: CHRD domain-containing protein [Flavobacterium sp.]
MKVIFNFLAALSLTCVLNSCSSDYNSSTPYTPAPTSNTTTYRATLNGTSEVPTNASTATGTATLEYNNTTKIVNVTVTYSGMTANGGEIAKGAIGVSGPTIFTFSAFTSPMYYTSVALDATQASDLNANLYYINLRSATYTNGEIRGQLIKQTSGNPY